MGLAKSVEQRGAAVLEPRLLACRVDALVTAHHVEVLPEVDEEIIERQVLCAIGRVSELQLGSLKFSLARSNSEGSYHLENHDCRVFYERDGQTKWNVQVVHRAVYLATHTLPDCLRLSRLVADSMGGVVDSRMRRFDLAGDYAGFALRRDDADRLFTTRAKTTGFLEDKKDLDQMGSVDEHMNAKRKITGITVSRGNSLSARIYNKVAELALPGREQKRPIEHELWGRNGWHEGEPVTRVELQVRGDALESFKLRNPDELAGGIDGVWQYGVAKWVRLVNPTRKRLRECCLDARWQPVIGTVFEHPSEPATRIRNRGGATAPQALGMTLSRQGGIGNLPNIIQGDETAFVDAMSPGEQEEWLKSTLVEVFKRQSEDSCRELILTHGARDAALLLALKINASRARYWSTDDVFAELMGSTDLNGVTLV